MIPKYKNRFILFFCILILSGIPFVEFQTVKGADNEWIQKSLQFYKSIGCRGDVFHETHPSYGDCLVGILDNKYEVLIFKTKNNTADFYKKSLVKAKGQKEVYIHKRVIVFPRDNLKIIDEGIKNLIKDRYKILK